MDDFDFDSVGRAIDAQAETALMRTCSDLGDKLAEIEHALDVAGEPAGELLSRVAKALATVRGQASMIRTLHGVISDVGREVEAARLDLRAARETCGRLAIELDKARGPRVKTANAN